MNCGNREEHEAHPIAEGQCAGISLGDVAFPSIVFEPGKVIAGDGLKEGPGHVVRRAVGSGDSLYEMIQRQTDFQGSLGRHFEFMDDEEKIVYIKEQVLALTDELHEALNEIGWKSWATSDHINREAFINELIDAWHFLMNLFIVVECPPHEIFSRYIEKNDKNWLRQKQGYDGVSTKCPGCKRAFDDEAVGCYAIKQPHQYVPKHIVAYCDKLHTYIPRETANNIPIDQYFEDMK